MKMSLMDMVLVGFPETFLFMLFIQLWLGNQMKLKLSIVRIIISVPVYLLLLNQVRGLTHNIFYIAIASAFFCTTTTRVILGLNVRRALLGAFTGLFIIGISEVVGFDLAYRTLHVFAVENLVDRARSVVLIITRVVQFISVYYAIKSKTDFEKVHIFVSKMSDLESQEKKSVCALIGMAFVCLLLLVNYIDVIRTINNLGVDRTAIGSNLNIFLMTTVILFGITVYLLNRTIKYEHVLNANKIYVELLERREQNENND